MAEAPEESTPNPADKPAATPPKTAKKPATAKKPSFNPFLGNNKFNSPKSGNPAAKGQAYKGAGVKKGK